MHWGCTAPGLQNDLAWATTPICMRATRSRIRFCRWSDHRRMYPKMCIRCTKLPSCVQRLLESIFISSHNEIATWAKRYPVCGVSTLPVSSWASFLNIKLVQAKSTPCVLTVPVADISLPRAPQRNSLSLFVVCRWAQNKSTAHA